MRCNYNTINVLVPTGKGTKGVDTELLEVVIKMMKELSICELSKFYTQVKTINYTTWGYVITGRSDNPEYTRSILRDLGFTIINSTDYARMAIQF